MNGSERSGACTSWPAGEVDLIASFPAAGSGGKTLEHLEKLAVRRDMAYVALTNPPTIDALTSGQWQADSVEELRRAAAQASARHVILIGHCMGGLSAVRLSDGLGAALGLPVSVLVINTPCPDSAGRIPTMSQFSSAQIADVLAHDGFPQDLLDDEDMLAEIADGLRDAAKVADRVAEWIGTARQLEALHVVSTRGDSFIPPQYCAGWWARVSGECHLTVADGGHTIDDTSIDVIERAIDAALASKRAAA